MGIELAWDEQLTNLIHLKVSGFWTWIDFHAAMDKMYVMMDESEHDKINFILDMNKGNLLPKDMLTRMQHIGSNSHPKSGAMMVIGAGSFVRMLFNIMDKLLHERMLHIQILAGMDEAYIALRELEAINNP